MLKLANKSFKIITENLKEKARPIDRERFNYHFPTLKIVSIKIERVGMQLEKKLIIILTHPGGINMNLKMKSTVILNYMKKWIQKQKLS